MHLLSILVLTINYFNTIDIAAFKHDVHSNIVQAIETQTHETTSYLHTHTHTHKWHNGTDAVHSDPKLRLTVQWFLKDANVQGKQLL